MQWIKTFFWLIWALVLFPISSTYPINYGCPLSYSLTSHFMDLDKQDRALIRDLTLINYPPQEWKIQTNPHETQYYDVAIIGGGMAGLTAGAALFKEGIFNIKIFDQNPKGYEGPWKTYARMRTLRSQKDLVGPALDIPHLTFHAWFEAQWGHESWKQLKKIPNDLWMDYLSWYRQALELPVENECTLLSIIPMQDCLELEFHTNDNQSLIVKARKVVLATGRNGFGGANIPSSLHHLPTSVYAHTSENIDFSSLKNQRIGVIGVGASAFDAAAVALENGAKSVDLLMRRERLPNVNKFASIPYKGFTAGYYQLNDEMKCRMMQAAFSAGIPPPVEAISRLHQLKNFYLRGGTIISHIDWDGSKLQVETNKGTLKYDFLIVSTGFAVDGSQQPELRHVIDQIALWRERIPEKVLRTFPMFGSFPYLGPTFEFLPKEPGTARYLKHLYCFNYAATLSHGLLSSDIPAISIGATRLAQGIAADFFVQDSDVYLEQLQNYQEPDFNPDDYFPNN